MRTILGADFLSHFTIAQVKTPILGADFLSRFTIAQVKTPILGADFLSRFTIAQVKTPILGADFLSHFNVSENMATRSLVDGNTELMAKGITSIYKSTGICPAIPDANGLQESIKKFPTLTTPFKHSDEVCGGCMYFGYFSRCASRNLRVLLSKLFPPQLQHKTLQSRKRNGIEHNEH